LERRWLKPKDAAFLLGCHLQTIYSGLELGDLPGARIKGIGWRLDRVELEKRIETEIQKRQQKAGRGRG
jgi:excisionase family DNA binding protein